LKKFDLCKFTSNSRNYYCDRFTSIRALESILSKCLFSSTDSNFDMSRVVEMCSRSKQYSFDRFFLSEYSKIRWAPSVRTVLEESGKDFLIGHGFPVLDIRWLSWNSKFEQNDKNIYFNFRPLVWPIVDFSGPALDSIIFLHVHARFV